MPYLIFSTVFCKEDQELLVANLGIFNPDHSFTQFTVFRGCFTGALVLIEIRQQVQKLPEGYKDIHKGCVITYTVLIRKK